MKTLVLFIAGSLLFGCVALGIGYAAGGAEALLDGAAGFVLTFVPAAITLAWVGSTYRSDPSMMLMASLGSHGIRMAVALGGWILLRRLYPNDFSGLVWWLALYYPVFLASEIALLVQQGTGMQKTSKT